MLLLFDVGIADGDDSDDDEDDEAAGVIISATNNRTGAIMNAVCNCGR